MAGSQPRSRRLLVVAAVAAILVLNAGLAYAMHATFTDVPDNHTHADGIHYISENGITVGCTPTTYCPNDPLTRAQMATFIHRLSGNAPDVDPNVNAATLDGHTAEELGAVFGARVGADGTLRGWFNKLGGEPTVNHAPGTGTYVIMVPGLSLDPDNFVASATPSTSVNQIGVDFNPGGHVAVGTRDSAGDPEEATFHVTVWGASTGGDFPFGPGDITSE